MGSTLKPTGDKVTNDNGKMCGVKGAYNLPIVYEDAELYTAMTPYPGYTLAPYQSSDGEDYVITCPDKASYACAFAEFDPGQVASCLTAYAAGDNIPIIRFPLNNGAICRNIAIANPAANLNPYTSLCTGSGTAGLIKHVTEPTLAEEADNLGFNAAATVGANGASGTTIISRIVAVLNYYLANPAANTRDVVTICWSR
jgi:hypothetical protein